MILSLDLQPDEVQMIITALQAKFMESRDINFEAKLWGLKLKIEVAAGKTASDRAKPIFCAPGFDDDNKIGDFSGGT